MSSYPSIPWNITTRPGVCAFIRSNVSVIFFAKAK